MAGIDRPARDRGLPAAVPEIPGPDAPGRGQPGPASPGPEEPAPAHGRSRRWRSLVPWFVAAFGVLVLPLAVAAGITWSSVSGGPSTARVVTADELGEEYGIKVDLVAVIAAGGLVDVRYTVLDKEKASHLLHNPDTQPSLYLESSGAVLRTSQAKAHKMTILDGASYFLLYPNSGGLIRAGTPVSIVIDSVRLEPVGAQS